MAEDNQAETTGDQTTEEKAQTVTIEQFEELKALLEATKSAQSGSDKTVKQLQDLLKQKEAEKEAAVKTESERIEAIEKELRTSKEREEKAIQEKIALRLLADEGLKAPGFLSRLIGKDETETQANINEYIEDHKNAGLETADKIAKKSGRKVVDVKPGMYDGLTYAEMAALPNEEYAKIPKDIVTKITKAAFDK